MTTNEMNPGGTGAKERGGGDKDGRTEELDIIGTAEGYLYKPRKDSFIEPEMKDAIRTAGPDEIKAFGEWILEEEKQLGFRGSWLQGMRMEIDFAEYQRRVREANAVEGNATLAIPHDDGEDGTADTVELDGAADTVRYHQTVAAAVETGGGSAVGR
jgi:hypothetical protein